MNIVMRPQVPADFEQIAVMESAIFPFPITRDDVAAQATSLPFCGMVAELDDQLVGRAFAGHMKAHTPEGDMRVEIGVAPVFRRHGIAARLWEGMQPFFAEQRPRYLRANGNPDQPGVIAWAHRVGFETTQHLLFQSLDLTDFDPTPWNDRLRATAERGIQFIPFGDLQSPHAERQLHAMYQEFLSHTPDADEAAYMDFEPWRTWAFGGESAWPGGCLIAIDANGDWLGFSLMQKDGGERAHTFMTGVVPVSRGKGLATALKVATALHARSHGVRKLTTLNHAANERIVAVNSRLGYKLDEGILRLVLPYARG